MQLKKIIFIVTGALCAFAVLNSCKKIKDTVITPNKNLGYISSSIDCVDSLGTYQQINIDIQKVSVYFLSDGGTPSWIDLPTKSGIYDLLKFQNGINALIVNGARLSGVVSQIRLVLGNNNTVMVNNIVYKLSLPKGWQTDMVIGNYKIDEYTSLGVFLHFDADKSVVQSGANMYDFIPIIKTSFTLCIS